MLPDEAYRLLSLLYAGPRGAVVRRRGRLEVVAERTETDQVELTQEQVLERGVEALLELKA
ncbi:hypothetical protein NOGI109294_15140 [Nocardiopsis gilva]